MQNYSKYNAKLGSFDGVPECVTSPISGQHEGGDEEAQFPWQGAKLLQFAGNSFWIGVGEKDDIEAYLLGIRILPLMRRNNKDILMIQTPKHQTLTTYKGNSPQKT